MNFIISRSDYYLIELSKLLFQDLKASAHEHIPCRLKITGIIFGVKIYK